MIKISDGNAFKLRVTALVNSAPADFNVVTNMIVNFVRRGRLAQPHGIDISGRLVISNDGSLARGIYGVEITGYHDGKPWRHYIKDAFKIVDENEDADAPSVVDDVPVYDLSDNMSFGGDGVTAEYVNAAISAHDGDEDAHQDIRQSKIDDVEVDGETIVEEVVDPVTGKTKRVARIGSLDFGKVDAVYVNGENVVEGKTANITVPTKVSDLQNDENFAKASEVEEALSESEIKTADATIDNNVGQPSATITKHGNNLHFEMHNFKGEPGARGNSITAIEVEERTGSGEENDITIKTTDNPQGTTFHVKNGTIGPVGPQGQAAILDPNTEMWATVEQTLGGSEVNPMSQDGISKEMTKEVSVVNLSNLETINYRFNNDGEWIQDNNCVSCFVTVQPDELFLLEANPNYVISYAFLTEDNHEETNPAYAGGATKYSNVSRGASKVVKAPYDATLLYIALTIGGNSYAPSKVAKLVSLKDNIVSVEADISSIKGNISNNVDDLTCYIDIDLSGVTATRNYINTSNDTWATYASSNKARTMVIPVQRSTVIQVRPKGSFNWTFLTSNATDVAPSTQYANEYSGLELVVGSDITTIQVPDNANYLYIVSNVNQDAPAGSRIPTLLRYVKEKTKDSISANKVLLDELTTEVMTDVQLADYAFSENNFASFGKHAAIPVNEGEKYIVGFNATSNDSVTIVKFATSNACEANGAIPIVPNSEQVTIRYIENEKLVTIPAGCNYLLVYNGGNNNTYKVKRAVANKITNTRTVSPKLTFEWLYYNNGSMTVNTSIGKSGMATPRFIKVYSDFTLESSLAIKVMMFYYDRDCRIVQAASSSSDYTTIDANTPTKFTLPGGCQHVKMRIVKTDNTTFTVIPEIKLTGDIPLDWDVFNPRSTDYGYQALFTRVWVTDPWCCDDTTSDVQDNGSYWTDSGVICLPPKYSNTGKPTRLIIYCHGAAVNYADGATRFNTQDLEPDYWLAEGYAVMDVEGNPFDNTNEHIAIPQAMDCYVAAYKWAIEHYNLRRDGVFLGGRSMGGLNTFNLIRRECPIPVIAACPNVPSGPSFGYSSASRKEFCAIHMGFDIPEGYTFKNTANMSSAEKLAEQQLLEDNWDKWVKCMPMYSMCTDLKPKEVMLHPSQHGYDHLYTLMRELHAVAKCPIKLFGCVEDEGCYEPVNVYYKMLINSGQIVERRIFHSNISEPHHYDTQDPNLRATVTTRYGEEVENVPVVYVEMLRFWRRYEQEEL